MRAHEGEPCERSRCSRSQRANETPGTGIIHTPEEWPVEDVDCDGDGGIAMATFSGPFAEERARWYAKAAWGVAASRLM
jgi:hypothetical protein